MFEELSYKWAGYGRRAEYLNLCYVILRSIMLAVTVYTSRLQYVGVEQPQLYAPTAIGGMPRTRRASLRASCGPAPVAESLQVQATAVSAAPAVAALEAALGLFMHGVLPGAVFHRRPRPHLSRKPLRTHLPPSSTRTQNTRARRQ